jgi:hypothetical protein
VRNTRAEARNSVAREALDLIVMVLDILDLLEVLAIFLC